MNFNLISLKCHAHDSLGPVYESWAYGPGGMGGHVPPQILRSGKNHCEIRTKHKDF